MQKQNTNKSKAEIAVRRKQVAALYRMKMTEEEITIALKKSGVNVSQPTVSRDITFLVSQWKEGAAGDIEDRKIRDVVALDYLELEANSLFLAYKKKNDQLDEGGNLLYGDKLTEILKIMDSILKIMDRRAKLLGLDIPIKVNLDANLKHSGGIDMHKLTDDELLELILNGPRN